ncbi:MAG: carboxypeptidase regulatory-like domain-containing protein [Silvibacterium sp.]|nr:carboxypeptidase regulatory-like domain-containing protein [Silvibacterium sp.]MBV8437542.1 carboxypeptidase regulatory-like domain-containing protein [Silvibacterium sp.]
MSIYKALVRLTIPAGPVLPTLVLALLAGASILVLTPPLPLAAQTTLSSDLAGNVTDPAGAVIPDAKVTVRNNATGATRSTATGGDGSYRFALLQPGQYTVTASASGFQTAQTEASIAVGTVATVNLKLPVGSETQTIEVTEAAPLLQTQNADISTTFNALQISSLPNPGNDITFMGQLAPGSVINSTNQASNGLLGYGNFSSFGLPATSNRFTVNGTDENDPFFNVNTSGATNLLLGNNEIAESTVTSNAYSVQFGGLGGAQLNQITKSGADAFHGNAVYWWNGRIMNANSYFNNQQGVPRPFVNDNQWAASLGGPIKRDKLFFFVDTEGVRFIFPTSTQVFIPSSSYETSVLGTVAANNPSEVPFYQNLLSLYNNAPGAAKAIPYIESGIVNPNVNTFRSTASPGAQEWLLTGRVDWVIGANDKLFGRYKMDRGFQPTYTDPINPIFDLVSHQPQYEGQLVETHSFSPNVTNQLLIYGAYYGAVFQPPNPALNQATFPGGFEFLDNQNTNPGTPGYGTTTQFNILNLYGYFSNGRNVSLYGVGDDFSMNRGTHTVRLGWNFKRDNITDYDLLEYNQPLNIAFGPFAAAAAGAPSLTFNNGYAFETIQNFPERLTAPLAVYQLGAYAEDSWAVKPNLRVTFGIRFEHNSNPVCQINCFSHLSSDFGSLAASAAATGTALSVPYNQLIAAYQHQAFHGYQRVSAQPRFGFTYSPGTKGDTVIRGGFGMFADVFPGALADAMLFNPPFNIGFSVIGGLLDPALPGSGSQIGAGAANSFRTGFGTGGSATTITAANPSFSPPKFTSPQPNLHYPTYEEWSLQVQRQFGRSTALTLGYVGNHGYHEPDQQNSANAYGFPGLPTTAPLPSFAQANIIESQASSNYNGAMVSLTHRDKYVTLTVNYTYSHALDEISNGGFLGFNPGNAFVPEDPYNLAVNYGNSDYDVRHNVTASYVVTLPYWHRARLLTDLWQFSGTVFYHTGFPFSVTDINTSTALNSQNYYGTLFAHQLASSPSHQCSRSAVLDFTTGTGTPCLASADFAPASGFAQGRRNQFFGPHYVDTDFAVQKGFAIPHHESVRFTVGAQFFNVLNHPNFAQPISDVSSPLFGLITSTVSTPTSIFGSGLGGDASPRLIQWKASFTF